MTDLVEIRQLLHPALSPRCAFKKHRCSSRSASLHLRAPWLRDGSPSAAAASFLPVATRVSSIRTRRQRWRSLIGRVRFSTRVPRSLRHWDTRGRLPVPCRTHLASRMRSGTHPPASGDRENTLYLRVIPRFHQPLKRISQLDCGRKNVWRTLQGRSVKSAFL